MPSPISSLPPRRTPAPQLIPHQWWRKNLVVISIVGAICVVLVAGVFIGGSRLLFLIPKWPTTHLEQSTPTDVVDTTIIDENSPQAMGEVIVSSSVGEDNFGLNPVEFDAMGMGAQSEIVLTSKTDMDVDTVLFHLAIAPAFDYDVISKSSREIKIKPTIPLKDGTLYRFSLDTFYVQNEVRILRKYQWGYEVKRSLYVRESMPRDNAINVSVNSPILLTMSTDNIDPMVMSTFLNIQPAMEGTITQHFNQYLFVPKKFWQDSTWYTVTLKKGMPIKKSGSVLDHDIALRFQTFTKSTGASLSNPESFIPDRLRISLTVQQQMALHDFGMYPFERKNEVTTVDMNTYRGVISLGLDEAIPFDQLPSQVNMDAYVVPAELAATWQRALMGFYTYGDLHSKIDEAIIRSYFETYGLGNPSFSQIKINTTVNNQHSFGYPNDELSVTELLALIAYANVSFFPKSTLTAYFESVYFSYDATASDRAQAAFGLASLGQPYVQEQVNLLNNPTLTPIDRLYLGLGLDRLGATEYTRIVYHDTLKDYLVHDASGYHIKIPHAYGKAKYATALTAIVGLTFGDEENGIRDTLHHDAEISDTVPETLYLIKHIENLSIDPHIFDVVSNENTEHITLDGSHTMWGATGNPSSLNTIKISGDTEKLRLLIVY
ncbi:MAG: Ig-like domain-containing protein [bacterium]|nr:Ig-like domain-containing protein [bacterium]